MRIPPTVQLTESNSSEPGGSGVSRPLTKAMRGQRRGAIVESLITDIFQGRLSAGQHLVTQDLAERFGVSHTPIREALIALGSLGLLTLQPNRGAVVRRISVREVREVSRVRRALECEAIRSACGHIDAAQLKTLRQDMLRLVSAPSRNAGQLVLRARQLDSELHDTIAKSAANQFLADELNRLKLLFRGLRDLAWAHTSMGNGLRRIAEESREHVRIIDALLKGDRRLAMTAMSKHIRSGVVYWSRALPVAMADEDVAGHQRISENGHSSTRSPPKRRGGLDSNTPPNSSADGES